MPLTTNDRIEKFISRLELLIAQLKKERRLDVLREIDQFYYMQKIEEYRILLNDYTTAATKLKTVEEHFACNYPETFQQWKKDMRYLHTHKRIQPHIIL